MPELIDSPVQAIENIHRYQTQLRLRFESPESSSGGPRGWYAIEADDGGPSKFIGYVGLTAETYVRMSARKEPEAGGRQEGARAPAVVRALGSPCRRARRRPEQLPGRTPWERPAECESTNQRSQGSLCWRREAQPVEAGRISIDQAICGGRPHITGTRVRVSDILNMLADGASEQEILADYPRLT